jgi:hypothetical protein
MVLFVLGLIALVVSWAYPESRLERQAWSPAQAERKKQASIRVHEVAEQRRLRPQDPEVERQVSAAQDELRAVDDQLQLAQQWPGRWRRTVRLGGLGITIFGAVLMRIARQLTGDAD